MEFLYVIGGLAFGAALLAGIRSLVGGKKSDRDVVSLN
jgi:hypothetical protein